MSFAHIMMMIFWLGWCPPAAVLHPFQSQWLLPTVDHTTLLPLPHLQTVTADCPLVPSLQLSPRLSCTHVLARNIMEPALSSRLASASSERLVEIFVDVQTKRD